MSNVLTRGLSLLLLPIITRILTREEYGVIDYLSVLGSLLAVTISLEVNQGMARYLPECVDDMKTRQHYASTTFWFVIFTNSLLVLGFYIFRASLSQYLLGSMKWKLVIAMAGLSYWSAALVYTVQSLLRWTQRAKVSALLSILVAILTMIFLYLFVVRWQKGVVGVLFGYVLGQLLSFGIGSYLIRNELGVTFHVQRLKEMLSFSIPLIPSSVGVVVSLYIDRIIIMKVMSLSDVGIYGVGYRVATIVAILMTAFQGALTPLIYAHYKSSATPTSLAKLFRIFVGMALLGLSLLSIFSKHIVSWIAPAAYREAASVIPSLTLAILMSNMYIFAPGLDIAKKTSIISVINISTACLNTGLSFILVSYIGIQGAAIATALVATTGFAAYMVFSQRFYYVPHHWGSLVLGFVLTLCAINGSSYIHLYGMADIILRISLIAGLLLALVHLGLVRTEEVRSGFRFVRALI